MTIAIVRYVRRKREYLPGVPEVFRDCATQNDEVFVNNARRSKGDGLPVGLTPEVFLEINASIFAKSRNRFAGRRIERVDEIHDSDKNTVVAAA